MKRQTLCWLFAAALLAGCAVGVRDRITEDQKFRPTQVVPQDLPTAIRTLIPARTANPVTPPASPPSTTSAPYPAAYPAPPTAQEPASGAYPYPAPQALAGGQATAAPAAPFHDCARTPGLVTCDPAAVPIKARLAYVDSSPARLVGLDLETGLGWQVALTGGAPAWLDWSNGDAQVAHLLVSLGDHQYQVYSADGRLLETFASEIPPAWQPDGALSRDGSVHTQAGDAARLEHNQDLTWLLHVKTSQGEKNLPLESNPGDILYTLLGWAPGSQKLLAQEYFAGNQAMTQGGQVITIDAASGEIQRFPARIPISDFPAAFFAWDPLHPTRVALLESSETSVLAPRLALLDIQSGKVELPLPENLSINSAAWHPDGRLAFAAASGETNPTAGQKNTTGAGINFLDTQTGMVEPLVAAPPDVNGAWLHWAADGQVLVYARALPGQQSELTIQVRAHRLASGPELVLVQNLPGSEIASDAQFLKGLLAFSLK